VANLTGSDAAGPTVESIDPERLDAYRVALEFQQLLPQILPPRGQAGLRDQLQRASASIVLNLAEGCGRWALGERAHFFSIARGSAMESAAVVDILHAQGVLTDALHRKGRGLLLRLVQMLTKLALKMRAPS
jgi:four helix bundle protein